MNRQHTFLLAGFALLVFGVGHMTAQDKTAPDKATKVPKREAPKEMDVPVFVLELE